jgi:hypothetical protein
MQPKPKHTPGPLDWQRFGKEWCLTGQYGTRPIVLSVSGRGSLMLRNAERDLLVPFSPDHPDARLLRAGPDLLSALRDALVLVDTRSPLAPDVIAKSEAAIRKATGDE